ncbi:hypothetical protein ABB37_00666 [Leptomonas pyrrhocoris]|uniref:Uncharacterized protein n=1 Tax=Leptomonas pyrrhocoris TaxID=157538 RepID=A0A0M9GAU0_LEPPY|nr:hypothetical protein ABB37_00666 [Leptomonas pyrrhocoris]KPA86520.1 hypothetical protein ABB37_00666 [Leptomonas pyrrhocoris]|eukprot:XP_015664959.1 hypothetical protein ABB37_00666 [Leptomonas pyrrhocoris]
MINSYIQNSSTMSTEDGSSSTVYGGPQPPRASSHHVDGHNAPSYTRQPLYDYFTNKDEVVVPKGKTNAPANYAGQSDDMNTNAPPRRSISPRLKGPGVYHNVTSSNRNIYGANTTVEEDARYSPAPSMRELRADRPASPHQQLQPKTITEQERAMLEVVLPVSTKLPSQEAQLRPLGLYVRAGRGGPNGVTRLVLVRLTDPADPFFLYELELLEDDYGAFKQRLELLVDFQGFPRYLVNMLRDVADGSSPYELSFVLHAAAATMADVSRGTLRVLETTEFKTVEHISLQLLRQGDAGLKRYLAERFQFYEHAFRHAEASGAALTADLQARVDRLGSDNDALRETLHQRDDAMRFMATEAEKNQLSALNRLREQHAKDTAALRESYEKKLETHTRALEEKALQLRDTTAESDAALAKLRARVAELEGCKASLQSQLRSAQDAANIQDKELVTLREMNDELANFKAEATKAMSENELNYVTLTERLRGTTTTLQSREEKVAALQEHYEKQDDYIRILADQNKQQAERVRETEKSLEKAHHIIANQLQTIKNAKDRYHIAADQLRSHETLLLEREGSLRRHQDEAATANERIQELLRKNNELRDQLEKTNSAREQLVREVKQTQQALLRLQQSTSINGRHWGVLSGAGGYRSGSLSSYSAGASAATAAAAADERCGTTASVPADLMREFGTNSNVLSPAGYRNVASSGGAPTYRPPVSAAPRFPATSSPVPGAGSAYPNSVAQGGPSLFHAHPTSSSPSPARSSQERGGSSETAGLTEPHGRTSTSSLAKTEPSPASSSHNNDPSSSAAAAAGPSTRRTQPIVGSVSLDKAGVVAAGALPPSQSTTASSGIHSKDNNIIRSSYNDLAVKSFFNSDVVQGAVTAGTGLESAYF